MDPGLLGTVRRCDDGSTLDAVRFVVAEKWRPCLYMILRCAGWPRHVTAGDRLSAHVDELSADSQRGTATTWTSSSYRISPGSFVLICSQGTP